MPTRRRLMLHLDWPLASFQRSTQVKFLEEFAILSGTSELDFVDVTMDEGCTIIHLTLDYQTVVYVIEMYALYMMGNHLALERKLPIFSFFERFCVSSVFEKSAPREDKNVARRQIENDPPIRPGEPVILFVHGLQGNDTTFGELPEFLSEETGLVHRKYNYTSSFIKKSPTLHQIAINLDTWIRDLFSGSIPPLIFYTHSMGGLVVRQMLVEQAHRSEPLDGSAKLIFFVASPFSGAAIATLANACASFIPFLEKRQLCCLPPDSDQLERLSTDWNHWSSCRVPKQCRCRCLYGTNDAAVAPASAIGPYPDPIPIPDKGHVDIVKPKSSNDVIVKSSVRVIKEARLSLR